ncbi:MULTISPECIES: YybH family protein [unclassified Sphingobium]|uniref:YybH family protein n=1 Tax=unclassified Sphingobium TaxID=2611147 RepID=UPI001A1286D2|nr:MULTISPECIES: DUF4440 domain-containing protein [unclassified Sphingobium]CAD7337809.1 hypothetical protein SPHS6_01686 [Sphingobium sp. S6]CAD7339049.1 hypothetical protein SPHS8_02426 [Sphingobium sp. S8]
MTARRVVLIAACLTGLVAARPPMRHQPDPSSVFAAEIAFNRLARDKGQWTAFRATAADDAVMFVPQRVLAKQWLKGRADPPQPVSWTPSVIHVSCDGNMAASTGNWQRPDGTVGYFTTIWRRDKQGAWKWVLDHGDTLGAARPAPEFLVGKVATCKRGKAPEGVVPKAKAAVPPADESLIWSAEVAPDGGRQVMVRVWNGTDYEVVIDDRVKAPAA